MSAAPGTEGRIRTLSHRSDLGEWRHALAVPAPDLAESMASLADRVETLKTSAGQGGQSLRQLEERRGACPK